MRKKVFYTACAIILGAILVFFSLRNAVRSSKTLHETISIQEIKQRPWIINDEGNLKSETELVIRSDHAFGAWCKITVAGKKAYIQSLGTLHAGVNNVIVNILELDKDKDNVTFAIYDNGKGSGKPLCTKTSQQKKIRHWKIYVAHDMHTDLGWNSYQEDLINEK